jgi:hypothetical protein
MVILNGNFQVQVISIGGRILKYKINLLDCKGCQECVFLESEKEKTEINKGQMIIKTCRVLGKKCPAIASIEKIERGNIFEIKLTLKNIFTINPLGKLKLLNR